MKDLAAVEEAVGLGAKIYEEEGVMGYAEFAGYSIKSAIESIQFKDSTDICHRFHPNAHLSVYLEREAFLLEGGVKNESAFPYIGGQN